MNLRCLALSCRCNGRDTRTVCCELVGRGRKRIRRLVLSATFGTSFQPPSGAAHPVPISGGRSAGRAATARHADTGRPAGWGSPGVGFAPWQLVVVARKSVARGKKAGRYVLSARPPRGRCGAGGGGDWPIHRPGPARQAARAGGALQRPGPRGPKFSTAAGVTPVQARGHPGGPIILYGQPFAGATRAPPLAGLDPDHPGGGTGLRRPIRQPRGLY